MDLTLSLFGAIKVFFVPYRSSVRTWLKLLDLYFQCREMVRQNQKKMRRENAALQKATADQIREERKKELEEGQTHMQR
jgi:hypothetical protein